MQYIATKLTPIVAGQDYSGAISALTEWAPATFDAGERVSYNGVIYESLVGTNTDQPDTDPTKWICFGPTAVPFYGFLCTATNTTGTVIATNGGGAVVTIPAGVFIKGVTYYISVKNISDLGGGSFIGLAATR